MPELMQLIGSTVMLIAFGLMAGFVLGGLMILITEIFKAVGQALVWAWHVMTGQS